MASKSRAKSSVAVAFFVMAVGALGLGAMTFYIQQTPSSQRVPAEIRRQSDVSQPGKPQPHPNRSESQVRAIAIVGDQVTLSDHTISVGKSKDKALAATDQVIEVLGLEGVRVLGCERVSGVIYLDFNPTIEEGMGSEEESQFLQALKLSLGQFDDVEKFKLRVDGKELDTLGHSDLSEPTAVIR